jgi:uncharacterized membrane protein YpjA
MEPGIREFFKRLVTSISLLVLWMIVNMVIGIKYGYAFFENKIQLSNIIFYVWIVASFIALIFLYIKIWKKPIQHLDD